MLEIQQNGLTQKLKASLCDNGWHALKPRQFKVLEFLWSNVGKEYPSTSAAVAASKLSERAFRASVQDLEQMGILSQQKHSQPQQLSPNSIQASNLHVTIVISGEGIKRIIGVKTKQNAIAASQKLTKTISKTAKIVQSIEKINKSADGLVVDEKFLDPYTLKSKGIRNSKKKKIKNSSISKKSHKAQDNSIKSHASQKNIVPSLSDRDGLKRFLATRNLRDPERKRMLVDLGRLFKSKYMKCRVDVMPVGRAGMVYDPADDKRFSKAAENCIQHDIDFNDYMDWLVKESKFTRQRFPTPALVASPSFMNGYLGHRDMKSNQSHDSRKVENKTLRSELESAGFEVFTDSELRYIEQICDQIMSGRAPNYSTSRFRLAINWALENVFKRDLN